MSKNKINFKIPQIFAAVLVIPYFQKILHIFLVSFKPVFKYPKARIGVLYKSECMVIDGHCKKVPRHQNCAGCPKIALTTVCPSKERQGGQPVLLHPKD